MAGGIDMTKLIEIRDDALRKAEQESSHELGHYITSQILRGQLKVAHQKLAEAELRIRELEQELDKYIGPKPHWDRWDYRDWRKRNKE